MGDLAKSNSGATSKRVWRVLFIVSMVLVFSGSALILLIASGAFDPQPLGPLLQTDLAGPLTLSAAGETINWQAVPWVPYPPTTRYSIRLKAAHTGGEPDSGYGLALSNATGRMVVAVAPLGYVAIWKEQGEDPPLYIMPWQTWPHILTGDGENEIWLDVAGTQTQAEITAWVNRERLWQGELDRPDGVGLWLGSFGGSVTVDYRSLEWFAGPPD